MPRYRHTHMGTIIPSYHHAPVHADFLPPAETERTSTAVVRREADSDPDLITRSLLTIPKIATKVHLSTAVDMQAI